MSLRLPQFLHRALQLRRARKALLGGDGARALELTRDPSLALSAGAHELRARALDWLTRDATLRSSRGDVAGAKACIDALRLEDPARAREWETEHSFDRAAASEGGASADRGSRALRNLLHEMRARGSAGAEHNGARGLVDAVSADPIAGTNHVQAVGAVDAVRGALRFHMSIDDGGEYLVASAPTLRIGHLRSPTADLAFLADVDTEHADLVACDSFHGGPTWALVKRSQRLIRVNGRTLERAGELRMLKDADDVELAANLRFKFRAPEVSSGSAVLELASGCECEGARRVLLLMPGEVGRIRIGARTNRHVRVADLAGDVSLELQKDGLCLGIEAPMRLLHAHAHVVVAPSDPSGTVRVALPCPPTEATHVSFYGGESRTAPFGISIRPADRSLLSPP